MEMSDDRFDTLAGGEQQGDELMARGMQMGGDTLAGGEQAGAELLASGEQIGGATLAGGEQRGPDMLMGGERRASGALTSHRGDGEHSEDDDEKSPELRSVA
jgi:hypothetical protein